MFGDHSERSLAQKQNVASMKGG